MTEITQADREAAISGYFAWCSGNPVIPNKIASGVMDDHSMVQAFARHRKYGYDQGYYDGRQLDGAEERAAIVAYARGHGGNAWSRDVLYFAEKIEAGEHLK